MLTPSLNGNQYIRFGLICNLYNKIMGGLTFSVFSIHCPDFFCYKVNLYSCHVENTSNLESALRVVRNK